MHLVTPREQPSYRISDLYKQWPQIQESNGYYPQVSLPSAAPGEPPQFLSTHTEFETIVEILFIPPSLCASFISYEGIDYHLPCEWSAVFVLPPEKTPAHSGRTEPSIWSLWLCWRGWPRRWQLEQGWTWLWQRQGEINLERVRVSLYFFLSVTVLGYVSLKVVSATDIPLQN